MDADNIPLPGQIFTGTFTTFDAILCIVLGFLLLCSAMVSASEVAFFSLSPSQLKALKEKGNEKALNLQRKPERLLATILISNNFVNVGIVIISTYLVNSLFNFTYYPVLGFIIQVVVVTFIILLVGEIMPKLYANRQQLKTITIMTGPLTVLSKILKPLSMLLIKSTSIISDKINKNDQISIDQLSTTGV